MSQVKQSLITAKIYTLLTTRSWPILDVLGTSVTRTIVYDDHESLYLINWSKFSSYPTTLAGQGQPKARACLEAKG